LSSKVGDHGFSFGGDGQPLLKFWFQEIGFVKIKMACKWRAISAFHVAFSGCGEPNYRRSAVVWFEGWDCTLTPKANVN
jgi:hypothetical protein